MFDENEQLNYWDSAEEKAAMAFELYEDGQIEMALESLESAIAINPENGVWHFNKGLALDALERYEPAIEEYTKALGLCGEDLEILNCLAVDYTRIGQFDKSLEIFERVVRIDPNFEPAYCNRIITYTGMEEHEKAEEMFYLAQQIEPECPICFYNIGNSLFSRGLFKRAVWCWERTAILDPEHPQINFRIAQGYWADGQQHLARIHFLNELRKDPGNIDVLMDYATFLLENGDVEGAREKYRRILELHPCFAPAMFYLGEIKLHENDIEAAFDFYSEAVRADRNLPGPRYRLASIAYEKKQFDQALTLMVQELELNVEDCDILQAMGVMFLSLSEFDYAAHCFLRMTEVQPDNPLGFFYLAMSLITQGEYADASQFLKHAIRLDKNNPEFHYHAAKLKMIDGKIETALKHAENAVRLAPTEKKYTELVRRLKISAFIDRLSFRKIKKSVTEMLEKRSAQPAEQTEKANIE